MQQFVVTGKEAGWRFDKYLKKLLPQAGSGFLYKMLRKKNITLNEKKAAGNEVVAPGDVVRLFFSEETFQKFSGKNTEKMENAEIRFGERTGQKEKLRKISGERADRKNSRETGDIPVIYEDRDILILNKPAGVLSQKAREDDISLNEWMLGYLCGKGELSADETGQFRPSVCNRLDRNTSGIVLCGKSVRGSQFLSEMLRNRSLHKYYVTYVQGRVEREILLNGFLKKEEERNFSRIMPEEEYRRLMLTDPEAGKKYKKIETVVKPVSYIKERDCTKLEILLVTGKSHQIRAHLASIGHPVLGDRKYGWRPGRKDEEGLKYQLLHAGRVEFPEIEGEFAYLSGKCMEAGWDQEERWKKN